MFWVLAGTSGGLPTNFMFEGGFLVCAALAGLVVADARLVEPGRLARGLAWRPLHFIGTISYGIYLWHWPVIVYINGDRTGLSAWPLDTVRVVVTLALSTASYYLVERPIRLARLHGWVKYWGAPLAGVATAVLIVRGDVPRRGGPRRGGEHDAAAGIERGHGCRRAGERARRGRVRRAGADPPGGGAVAVGPRCGS